MGNEKAVGKTLKFSVFDLVIMRHVMRDPGSRSYGVKDLRLIQRVLDKVQGAIPANPSFGERPKVVDEKNPTQEELQAIKSWNDNAQKIKEEYESSEVNLEVSDMELMVIKQKFAGFQNFVNDDVSRPRIVSLAEKLQLEM